MLFETRYNYTNSFHENKADGTLFDNALKLHPQTRKINKKLKY